jgi:hypothetical protein
MTWIRSPLWDGVWILSAPVAGLAALVVPFPALMAVFFYFNMAHLTSPLAVAWGSQAFRQNMYAQWGKYILFPLCIMIASLLIGLTVDKVYEINPVTLGVLVHHWSDSRQPLVIMLVVYFFWNAYHFGMQHFGILSLYRRGRRSRTQRRVDMWLCLFLTTVLGMIVLPKGLPALLWFLRIPPWQLHLQQISLFVVVGFLSINHSMAAIGISSHVMASQHGRSPWLFAIVLLAIGAVVLWVMFYAPGFTIHVTMTALALRLGLGFVHFLYDRWIYKLSDPAVRAIIWPTFSAAEKAPRASRLKERAYA